MKLDSIAPAFMLKANRNKQFWSNVVTTAEYAADILTTVSGVGNIAKFRYLAKFAAKASKLRFVSKAGRTVAAARKAVAATAAVVEITSGTVNALLKLTGVRDTEWGKSLSEYLFWLELLSLSGELTVAIHNGLRKSAKEILKHEDGLRKSAKNADEAKQIDVVIEELKRMADGGNNPKFSLISKKVKDYWTKFLIKKGVKIEIGTEEANRILDENFADGLFIRKGFNSETNQFKEQIIYLKENPSTSAFSEETYHALQNIEGVQMYKDVTYKGILYKNVDNWEFLTKKRILDEAEKNGISYEEYIFVEKQLDNVLNKIY